MGRCGLLPRSRYRVRRWVRAGPSGRSSHEVAATGAGPDSCLDPDGDGPPGRGRPRGQHRWDNPARQRGRRRVGGHHSPMAPGGLPPATGCRSSDGHPVNCRRSGCSWGHGSARLGCRPVARAGRWRSPDSIRSGPRPSPPSHHFAIGALAAQRGGAGNICHLAGDHSRGVDAAPPPPEPGTSGNLPGDCVGCGDPVAGLGGGKDVNHVMRPGGNHG